jgi:hypothetical protein
MRMTQAAGDGSPRAIPLAVEHVVHLAAAYAAPYGLEHSAQRSIKLRRAANTAALKAQSYARTNTANIRRSEVKQGVRQIRQINHHRTVRFLHVGGKLAQQNIRCDADGAT